MNEAQLAAEWTRIIAPRTGDVRADLLRDAADFLGITETEARRRHRGAGERFRDEWTATIADPSDRDALAAFYNRSDAELFELIEWHANDAIHYRALILRDLALSRPGRSYLDYGSGIGNDALVFADAGFRVTLADVSEPLLAFAAWRCRRRGLRVQTVDLKTQAPAHGAFDVVVCFDVLEHIPKPLVDVRRIRASLREGGLVAIHAPFGADPEHPMHVVHRDTVTPRMRSLGFAPLDCAFPPFVRAPRIYRKRTLPVLDRAGYFIYDNYLHSAFGGALAAVYRRALRRGPAGGDGCTA